ncbi:hypothetical protein STEG23_022465 [Scotinomys teguina]
MLRGLPGNPTSSLHGGLASSLPAALPWTPPLPFLVPPSGPSPNQGEKRREEERRGEERRGEERRGEERRGEERRGNDRKERTKLVVYVDPEEVIITLR